MNTEEMALRRARGESWGTIAAASGMSRTGVRKRLAAYVPSNPEPEERSTDVATFGVPHAGFRVGGRQEAIINPRTGRKLRPPRSPYERWLDRRDGIDCL